MSDNLKHLDDHRPHLSIRAVDGNFHVYPVRFFYDVVNGRTPTDSIDDEVLQSIIKEWLEGLGCVE